MGRDNQSRARQANKLKRKQGNRPSADRLLIVTEGEKSEPLYLNAIRQDLRLPTANIQVLHSGSTSPDKIVEYAKNMLLEGSIHKKIDAKSFDKVFVVFDRDDHVHYHNGLQLAKKYDNAFANDTRKKVPFKAIVSVPSFELWLLLHFQDLTVPSLHRDEVIQKLKKHIPSYEKGQQDCYNLTKANFEQAKARAIRISLSTTAENGKNLYTNMHTLVDALKSLKTKHL